MSVQAPVRVLVVDDSEVFRNVLCAVVAATPGFQVIGVAGTGREALDLVGLLDVQFVLIDVNMPELDGVETARRIRRRHPGVLVRLLTATSRASVLDASLAVEDKRDLSPDRIVDLWRRHGNGAGPLRESHVSGEEQLSSDLAGCAESETVGERE